MIYPLSVEDIAQAQEEDSVLKKLSKTDKYSTQLVEEHKSCAKMARWSPPNFFSVEQLVGITTTFSIQDTYVFKRRYTQQCIGRV